MAYIMDSGQKPFTQLSLTFFNENRPYWPIYPKNEIYHISEKMVIFNSKNRPRNVKSGPIGKPR